MNNRPPLNEGMATGVPLVTPGWANWFGQVFAGLPWKKGWNVTATINFGFIVSLDTASSSVSLTGARTGDAVQITTPNVAGIIFSGCVTADDTVTVYAKNFSSGAVNPPSQVFRIIVLQN